MATFLKHVGQVSSTGKKCVVVFRTIPGEENFCLLVETESLSSNFHDDLQTAVESQRAQETVDFYTYAQRETFHNGRNMLNALHQSGWLKKIATSDVIMKPTLEINISLAELNQQLGKLDTSKTSSADIGRNMAETVTESKPAGVLDDQQIADSMRQQATQFRAEADRLLKEADVLSPSVKTKQTVAASEAKPKRAYNKKK